MSLVACKTRSGMDTIDYPGQRIKLSRSYPSYEAYQSDPNNIDPSERARVRQLVTGAPIKATYEGTEALLRALGEIKFPGYAMGGFGNRVGPDDAFIGQPLEIPFAEEDRVLVFRGGGSRYSLIDDFILPTRQSASITTVRADGEQLSYLDRKGTVVVSRPAMRP
jgi:hypothetical protein